jgi:glycosyltransferase involved in cell wall biosynthesis
LDRYRQAYQVSLSQTAFILPNSLDLVRTRQVSYLGTESFDGQAGSNPNALRLLTVARLVPKELGKGVDTVIRALPELLSGFPDLRYSVIGDGSDRTRLEHLAQEMRVDHAVEFRGFVSETELEREYSNCAVYVMPSASEGFGLVFIEAMAHGKPVVAARVGGTPEVVQDRVSGLLIDFGDVPALTQSVKRLLEDADLRLRMGQASLQRVRENYTYDIFCQRVAQILSEISRIQI